MPNLKELEISTFVAEKYGLDGRTAGIIGKNMAGSNIRGLIEVAGLVDDLRNPHEWLEYYKMLVEKKRTGEEA